MIVMSIEFKLFPKDKTCIICNNNTEGVCMLIAVDGTEQGNRCEAIVAHIDCIYEALDNSRYNKIANIVYFTVGSQHA